MTNNIDLDKDKIYIFKNNILQERVFGWFFFFFEKPVKYIIIPIIILCVIFLSYYWFKKPKFDIYKARAEKIKILRTIPLLQPSADYPLNIFPTWSPDGKNILFISIKKNAYALSLINSDGSGKIKDIITSQKPINWLTKHSIFEIKKEPIWSPDGKYIAYISNKNGVDDIWLTDINGSFQKQITFSEFNKSAPSWSPDGRYLIYQTYEKNISRLEIITVSGQQADIFIRSNFEANEAAARWSPDGKYIAYTSNAGGKYEVWLYDIFNKIHKQLTTTEGNSGAPDFSPDSQKIIFLSETDNNQEIFIINIDGSGFNRLTNTPDKNELTGVFSPSGNDILCSYSQINSDNIEIALLSLGWKD